MTIVNFQTVDPVTKADRIMLIQVTDSFGAFSFRAAWSDEPAVVIASGSNVATTFDQALHIARACVGDALNI